MKKLSLTFIALSLTAFLGFFSPAFAQTVVFPNGLENTEGNFNLFVPFDCAPVHPSLRYQQVYLNSHFPEAGLIYNIRFRLNNDGGGAPGFGPTILPSVQIELSTTQAQPNALSNTFADNVGPDVQAVFSGNLTLSAPDCNTQPCPFDIMIQLQNPFFYDPQDGNLLLDVRISDCVITGLFDGVGFSTITSLVHASDVNSAVANTVVDRGLVTQFLITEPPPSPPPAAPIATDIPTISEWGLIITASLLGIIGLMVIRRRKLRASP